jgi:hypothetical protein
MHQAEFENWDQEEIDRATKIQKDAPASFVLTTRANVVLSASGLARRCMEINDLAMDAGFAVLVIGTRQDGTWSFLDVMLLPHDEVVPALRVIEGGKS